MKRIKPLLALLLLAALLLQSTPAAQAAHPAQDPPPPPEEDVPETPSTGNILLQSVRQAMQERSGEVMAFALDAVVVDHINFSEDGQTALVWLAFTDPQTGEIIATEPGLAIARLNGADWRIHLQTDADWAATLDAVPLSLLDNQERLQFDPRQRAEATASTVYTGYYLPWAKGLSKRLSGSIDHFLGYKSCSEESCRYAYDFADGTMFPMVASKGGTVFLAKWNCANGDEECSNYIVIKDTTTSPTTYQLYLHLANNSIPSHLRTIGAPVRRGEFIGNADDTGWSTGHHLHFHVHTNPYSYWGNSVDIVFADVTVNSGRPRTCSEVAAHPEYGTQCMPNDLYTSGNTLDDTPPKGGLLDLPRARTSSDTGIFTVSGWGSDNVLLSKMQVIATNNGVWKPVGAPQTSSPFTTEVNVCQAGIGNGPLALSLDVVDWLGQHFLDLDNPRHVINNANCAPPIAAQCIPEASQAAIFSDPFYQGDCRLLSVGDHATMPIGANNVESILLGSGVRALLYDDDNFQGRRQTLHVSDPNINDNPMRGGINSMRVQPITTVPVGFALNWPGQAISTDTNVPNPNPASRDTVVLSWGMANYGQDFRAELTGPNAFSAVRDWSSEPFWSVGTLAPGEYTWTVTARNKAGQTVKSLKFTVDDLPLPESAAQSVPYSEDFEAGDGGWTASGLWRWGAHTRGTTTVNAWVFNRADTQRYEDAALRAGDLTSPPMLIPPEGAALRFRYYSSTEGTRTPFDQRRVQISVDGGAFSDLWQASGDRNAAWLDSPAIDLGAYAGHSVRLRFHFNTLDGYYNTFSGWLIDSVHVEAVSAPECSEAVPDDSPASATPLAFAMPLDGVICPTGDQDYYVFNATAGQRITLDVDATVLGSPLDAVMTLLDSDGTSLLAENLDQAAGQPDPYIEFTVPWDGRFFVRITPYAFPGAGGSDHTYRLTLRLDAPPQVFWVAPIQRVVPGTQAFPVSVQAGDAEGAVVNVELLVHSTDWVADPWQSLGPGTPNAGTWSWVVNPTTLDMGDGLSLAARATDTRGNQRTITMWDLKPDRDAPQTTLRALPATSTSTLIQLNWRVEDGLSDLSHFVLENRVNGGSWQTLESHLAADTRAYWFWGAPGQKVDFCLRGVDTVGNTEACPAPVEATTTFEASCAPDTFEAGGDGLPGGAPALTLDAAQEHNLCAAGDVDWVKINLSAGQTVAMDVYPLGGHAGVQFDLYGQNSSSVLLLSRTVDSPDEASSAYLTPAQSGTYYLRIRGFDARLGGSAVRYGVRVSIPQAIFLPLNR